MKCLQCEKEFEGRVDARFCSTKCRVTHSRHKGVTAKEKSVTDNVECFSKLGDRHCSCGARIRPVMRPEGPHEVVTSKGTRPSRARWTSP